MSNNPIRPIDRTLSSITTPGQSRLGSNGNEEVLHIPQSSSITGASPSDCLMSYPRHLLAAGEVLPLCRDAVGVFYSPRRQGFSLFLCGWGPYDGERCATNLKSRWGSELLNDSGINLTENNYNLYKTAIIMYLLLKEP